MSKLCFVDVETTGLDPQRHCPWQIAVVIDIHGQEEYSWSLKFQPLPNADITLGALKIGGVTTEEFAKLPTAKEAQHTLESVLSRAVDKFDKTDKLWFIGYNAQFDYSMLRAWFERQGDNYFASYFWHPPIDVMGMAAQRVMLT